MDRLKPVLAILKKQHFWLLCGVIVVVCAGLWWVTTGSLDTAVAARNTEIQSKFSAMTGIINQPEHPNEKVIADIKAETAQARRDVLDAWRSLYLDQKAKNRLPELLTQGFRRAFENQDPTYVIDRKYCEEYMNFIGRHLPKLFEIGDVWRPGEGVDAGPAANAILPVGVPKNAAAGADAGDNAVPMIGVVEWVQGDQDRVRGYFNWSNAPSTTQVRLAQEDLWVYEALLRIIRNTNGPVKNRQDAAIKRILALRITQDAVAAWQSDGGSFVADSAGAGGGAAVATGQAGGASDADLVNNRYVDDNGLPLATGQPHPYAEFKLMPVYLQLVMNQKKLPKLLVECANSSMPIEVRKVTLDANPDATTPARDTARGGAAPTATPTPASSDMDMQVAIQGTICIYNPPDEATLGTGAAAETPAEAAPPAEPAEAIPVEAASTGETLDGALAGGPRPAASGQTSR